MEIVTKNEQLLKSFWLYFWMNGIGVEWHDEDLPIPTLLKHTRKGYYIGYAIEGYFATKKSQDFLNDIIARFLITFKMYDIKRLDYKPTLENLNDTSAHIYAKIYKLRQFSRQLDSLQTKKYIPGRADIFEDYAFWAIKLYAEDLIRATGFIVYDSLESWAMSQFIDKERSTIRAKCRSVYNWYEERDFEIQKKHKPQSIYLEETMASRKEHITKLNKERGINNKKKVLNVITGMFADEYKKKSGAWHYLKIAKDTNLSRYTVAKIIKQFEEENS